MSARTLAVGLAVGLASLSPQPVRAQDEIVTRGNLAYQEGDYAAAIDAYEAVSQAGFTSAGLEYNLGNAYFKSGDLGPAILHWERALKLSPGDPDTRANLELARSLTTDAVEPLPTFWVLAAIDWWINLLSKGALTVVVALAWLALASAVVVRILVRSDGVVGVARWVTLVAAILVGLFGSTLLARELGIGRPERAVILVDAVSVRSAPAEEDDLTLFEVHEGTRVRVDQQTGEWAEVVLDDGKVGWIPVTAMEVI